MQKGTCEAQHSHIGQICVQTQEPGTHPQAGDSHVFHRGIGQYAFEIAFVQKVHNRPESRDGKDETKDADLQETEVIDTYDQHNPIKAGFYQHRAHDPRDMGGRYRMGLRQPGGEGEDAGFEGKAYEDKIHRQ